MIFKFVRNGLISSVQILKSVRTTKVNMSTAVNNKYETLQLTVPAEYIVNVELNRPDKLNAMNHTMWIEIKKCFEELSTDVDCRVVVLSAAGKLYTAGLDLNSAMDLSQTFGDGDIARKGRKIEELIKLYQDSMSSLEICRKPVLTGIHGACVGAGTNLITAADIRYCTNDAWFQIKEVDLGLTADVGVLQRFPKVTGSDSLFRELCYTGRKLLADEAKSCGLVSKVFENKESMIEELLIVAKEIALKSPVVVQTLKSNIVYSRDHSVQEGLDNIRIYNQFLMQSEDFANGIVSQVTKEKAIFSKL